MQNRKDPYPPKVSIGIPTYNRAHLLRRSIESALGQDYPNIEVLISDNASIDNTTDICRLYAETYLNRVKYVRQPANFGATANFSKVLEMASGEFFMWLGDDDWIDASYVRLCIQEMLANASLSLVSGRTRYYRNSRSTCNGNSFSLLHKSWWLRVILYYMKVSDNGMFYGLMRTAQIRRIRLVNTMGGDWVTIASVASLGKIKTLPVTGVHRELGGATVSYRQIAHSMRLTKIQIIFPITSAAVSAWADIILRNGVFRQKSGWKRLLVGSTVFSLILLKQFLANLRNTARFFFRALRPSKNM